MRPMFAASSPSKSTLGGGLQPRVQGGLRLFFRDRNGQTHAASYEERDGYKIRFPRGTPAAKASSSTQGAALRAET